MVQGDGGGDAVLPESMADTLIGPAFPKKQRRGAGHTVLGWWGFSLLTSVPKGQTEYP